MRCGKPRTPSSTPRARSPPVPRMLATGSILKRMMMTVVVALLGCAYMAMYNTGYQAHLAISVGRRRSTPGRPGRWRPWGWAFDPASIWACIIHGALYYLPILIVTLVAGGFWEVVFAIVRKHEINEGFFVTWMLFPLILPATTPALAGGLGDLLWCRRRQGDLWRHRDELPQPGAHRSRLSLFRLSGRDLGRQGVDHRHHRCRRGERCHLAGQCRRAADRRLWPQGVTWWDAFIGTIPGSMGETSALACLIGAVILIATGVGSWRIMGGVVAGTAS